jgi:hypothetical protein
VVLELDTCTVTASALDGVNAGVENTLAGTLDVTVVNTTIDGGGTSDNALRMHADGNGVLSCRVEQSTLADTVGSLLAIDAGGSGSDTTCTIGGAGVGNAISGSSAGSGIDILADGDAPTDVLSVAARLQANVISSVAVSGVRARLRDAASTSTLDVRLVDNTVSTTLTAGDGVALRAEDDGTLCAAFSGNTSTGGTGDGYALTQLPSAAFDVEGGAGSIVGGTVASSGTIGTALAPCSTP